MKFAKSYTLEEEIIKKLKAESYKRKISMSKLLNEIVGKYYGDKNE